MSRLHTEFTSDSSKLEKAYDKLQKEAIKLREENKRLAGESKKGAKETEEGFEGVDGAMGDVMDKVKGMAAGYLSVQAAVGLVNNELKLQIELQNKAREVQISEAQTQIKFLRNLGTVSDEERAAALATAKQIAADTDVSVKDVYSAASSAVSARGALSVEDALRAVRTAADVAPEDTGEMTAISGALLDIASLTKSTDAKANLGFILQGQSVARLTKLESFGKNIVPAALNVAQTGDSAVESLALPTALTLALKDPEGAVSGTASIQLANQLQAFFKERRPELRTTRERLEALQKDQALGQEFLGGASFEAKAKNIIGSLIAQPEGEVAQIYRQNLAAIKPPEEAAAGADALIKGIQSVDQQQTAATDRSLKGVVERYDSEQTDAARIASVRDALTDTVKRTGTALDAMALGKQFDIRTAAGADPTEVASAMLESSLARLEGRGPRIDLVARAQVEKMDQEERREQIALLRQMLAKLEERNELARSAASPGPAGPPAGALPRPVRVEPATR